MLPILRAGPRTSRCRQLPIRSFSISCRRRDIDATRIHQELTARQLPLLFDELSPKPAILLRNTLSEFLPQPTGSNEPQPLLKIEDKTSWQQKLQPGHHLIYFPPASRLSELLPDGTDPQQSPGEPFVRRMWAGGSLSFPPPGALVTNGSLQCCFERINDVKVKGRPGEEKIFVTIERRVSRSEMQLLTNQSRESIVEQLSKDDNCSVIEERNIVFMKERTSEELKSASQKSSRAVSPPNQATHSHVYIPSRSLLFRFSALTWNAHSIHLDQSYCRDIEGHRNLLVHGPLSLVMLLDFFRSCLGKTQEVAKFEYRNLAPLYSDEECQLCMREKQDGQYELWIENAEGGLCVRGTATVRAVESK